MAIGSSKTTGAAAADARDVKSARKTRKAQGTQGTQDAQGADDALFSLRDAALSFEETSQRFDEDKRAMRRRTIVFGVVLLAVVIASLHIAVSVIGVVYTPATVIGCYIGWFKINVASIFVPSLLLEKSSILAQYPMYYEVTTRFAYTFITLVCGVMLSVSGMLYQNVFRNPIAAPTMLGVSSGITIGQVLLVWAFGTAAVYMTTERYLYSYIGGVIVLAVVVGFGKLISGKRPLNLVDVLLVGTIVSSLLGTVVNYLVNYVFTDSQWEAYYELNNVTTLDVSATTVVFLLVVAAVTFVPIVLFRFRMNCIAFSDQDMRLFGIDPTVLRVIALVSGSLMILTAQVFMGTVSMVSLVVPFVTRAIYGSEFRKQLLGNAFLGAILLLVCRDLTSLIPFVGDGIPVGTIVTFVTLPAFVWIMACAQKQWNEK